MLRAARIQRAARAAQIKTVLAELEFSEQRRLGWFYRPEQAGCLGWAQETCVIYECYDEYRIEGNAERRQTTLQNERLLLQAADVVFVTSRRLHDSRSRLHSNVHYAPNGVDIELFAAARRATTLAPPDLESIPRPRVGFVGNVSGHAKIGLLDVDLLLQVSQMHPEWSFVLVGPRDGVSATDSEQAARLAGLAELERRGNVHLMGRRPYAQVPHYLQGMDVTIMPFSEGEYLNNINPLKLWEYLASGKVVVSTPFDEVNKRQDIVHVTRTPSEFAAGIETALTSDPSERIARGVQLAREHGWDRLTRKMLDVLSAELS
jgi:glycosyltransferase involved in cell wall biosynthesis